MANSFLGVDGYIREKLMYIWDSEAKFSGGAPKIVLDNRW